LAITIFPPPLSWRFIKNQVIAMAF
jgi:hypothetical protein